MTAEPSRAARRRQARPAREPAGEELIEVTFTPAEPQLTPGAARAVLALLLRGPGSSAGQGPSRERTDLKSAAKSRYHRGPGTCRACSRRRPSWHGPTR